MTLIVQTTPTDPAAPGWSWWQSDGPGRVALRLGPEPSTVVLVRAHGLQGGRDEAQPGRNFGGHPDARRQAISMG